MSMPVMSVPVPAKMNSYSDAADDTLQRKAMHSTNKERATGDGSAISSSAGGGSGIVYHRPLMACCILAGDTDGGGLDMVRPLAGLMMGIALRARVAAGWCNFKPDC